MTGTPTLAQVAAELRRVAGQLERLSARLPLPEAILTSLAVLGPVSTNAVRRSVGRRSSDVRTTLLLLEQAGRVRRSEGRWALADPSASQIEDRPA